MLLPLGVESPIYLQSVVLYSALQVAGSSLMPKVLLEKHVLPETWVLPFVLLLELPPQAYNNETSKTVVRL
jgi:hypothetical protein